MEPIMEETLEKPGFFSKFTNWMHREVDDEEEYVDEPTDQPQLRVHTNRRYHITVRRQVVSFQDAVTAADGLRRGEQQVINLTLAAPELRAKIIDFMAGVNYIAEGTWEELGDNVYLLAPPQANVEVAPSSPRTEADRN